MIKLRQLQERGTEAEYLLRKIAAVSFLYRRLKTTRMKVKLGNMQRSHAPHDEYLLEVL